MYSSANNLAVRPDAAPLLEVRDLTVNFDAARGQVTAVAGVSFDLAPGETLGMVGESGCGKTVTALSILRLLQSPPAEVTGAIRFQGEDLTGCPEARMRQIRGNRIAMVFQEPMTALNPVLTIGEQVAEALRLHRGMSHPEAWREAAAACAYAAACRAPTMSGLKAPCPRFPASPPRSRPSP